MSKRKILERIANALTTRTRHVRKDGHYLRYQPLKRRIRIWDIDGRFGHIMASINEAQANTPREDIIACLESIGAKKARYR